MRIPIVLLVTIAAGAAGFSTGLLSRAPLAAAPDVVDALPSPEVVEGSESDEVPLETPGRRPSANSGAREALVDDSTHSGAQDSSASPLFSATLLAHHEKEFSSGWKSVRADQVSVSAVERGELDFRRETLLLSSRLGAEAAEALSKQEAATDALKTGSAAGMLVALNEGAWTPPNNFVTGGEFAEATLARSGGGSVSGEDLTKGEFNPIGDGSVVTFGPGVHTLDERSFRGADRQNVPKDITVIGAGKNSTLLRMGDIGSRADIQRLTFRNLTIDADNDGLFDQRGGSLSLHLESARVVRFDAGHGGCYIFSTRGGCAVTAVDTEFTGGYGRSPGNGSFLRGEPFLGHFKNCTFELVEFRHLKGLRSGQVRFDGCHFTVQEEDPSTWQNPVVTTAGCSYEEIPRSAEGLQKDLADLFPQLR
jgi:hypothetical protein